jgi:RNA recognition motif-containing protein
MENSKVFIANLNRDISVIDFRNSFSVFGKIVECNIVKNKNANLLNYGFIQFDTPESANEMVRKTNGMTYFGNTVNVKISKKHVKSKNDDGLKNVYIKNLPKDITKSELTSLFIKSGPILSSMLVMNREKNEPNGCAFVKYMNVAGSNTAIDSYHNYELRGNKLEVNYANTKSDNMSKERYSLYVNNLPDNYSQVKIRQLFAKFGKIFSSKIVKNYGFVIYFKSEDAIRATKELNGFEIDGNIIQVSSANKKNDVKEVNIIKKMNQDELIRLDDLLVINGPMAYDSLYNVNYVKVKKFI